MAILAEAQGIHYSYRAQGPEAQVLKGVDLAVQEGSFTCLIGPSGSGKTTLLNLLGLLDRPQEGRVRFAGEDTSALTEGEFEALRLQKLGFVFQSFHLIPTLSALENTTYFLGPLGLPPRAAAERAEEVLRLVGLIDHRHKRPAQLSSGERQRVAIARAVAKRPRLLLADEPTASLDRRTAEGVMAVFQELRRQEALSLVCATHDLHLLSYADSVYHLQDGRAEPEARR